MAQPMQQQFSSQPPFSPLSNTAPASTPSPVNPAAPAIKRQRLSPLPPTTQPSPAFGTMQMFPSAGSSVNGMAAGNMSVPVNPPPPPPPGSMGPPSKPSEKATDTAELTDVLASSGIDVKEEEAFLTGAYRSNSVPPQASRGPGPYNTVFTAQGSRGPMGTTPATLQTQFNARVPYPSSPSTPAPPTAPSEDEKFRQDSAAARREQYPLQSPFLHMSVVEDKFQRLAAESGVRVPNQGVYRPYPGRPTGPVEITGPDGSSVVRTGQTLLTPESPVGDILSLLSLACEERLRAVVEQASALSKGRQMNSHGIVPADWTDMATPQNQETMPAAGQKRSISSRPVSLVSKSKRLIDREVSLEDQRAAKRTKRSVEAPPPDADNPAPSVSGTATPAGSVAPDGERKVTKKELKKAESKVSEAVQHQQTIEATRMATNNLTSGTNVFGKKKKYNWLQSGSAATSRPLPATAKANANNAASSSAKNGSGNANTAAAPKLVTRHLGVWREDDKERGGGIQTRDLLFVLEVDGKGTKHLQRGYVRDPRDEYDRLPRDKPGSVASAPAS